MAVSIFPTPTVSTSSTQFITIPDGSSLRSNNISLQAGVYSITATNASYSTTLRFYNGSTYVTTVTTSGTTPLVLNLATPVTKVWAYSQFGAPSLQVGFTLTGVTLLNTQITGTVDTITSTSNYTATNQLAFVVAIGGGGGGNGTSSSQYCGGGGGSGAVVESGPIVLNGTYAVTIGNGGPGIYAENTGGSSGGTTSFGSLFTAGGGNYGGNGPYGGNGGAHGSATGTYSYAGGSSGCQGQNGGGGGNGNPYPTPYAPKFQWTVSGTVAGGNGGGFSGASTLGLGTNIGTGGHSGGGNASGFGCGGGGRGSSGGAGGNGTAGVVYILKVSADA